MPVTPFRNWLYRTILPLFGPSTRHQYRMAYLGAPLTSPEKLIEILVRHHVLGGVVRLAQGSSVSTAHASLENPHRQVTEDTLFRTASITKTAVSIVSLRLVEKGMLPLHESIHHLLPAGDGTHLLAGVTLHHLLSHRSGLQDTPAYLAGLQQGHSFHRVLTSPGTVSASKPGTTFSYSNFGYGLIGCLWEAVLKRSMAEIMAEELLIPLGMRGTLDGAALSDARVMAVARVLPYRPGHEVTIPWLGRKPLQGVDPELRYGITAGSLYTDATSLSRMLGMLQADGLFQNTPYLSASSVQNMTTPHSQYGKASPTMAYGLGLTLLNDPRIASEKIIGHQGYAYGCAHGMFYGATSGQQLISLNGGCSEARTGMLGLCSFDLLKWAWQAEFPGWRMQHGTGH